jgi:hypothetical protein
VGPPDPLGSAPPDPLGSALADPAGEPLAEVDALGAAADADALGELPPPDVHAPSTSASDIAPRATLRNNRMGSPLLL